MVKVKVMSVEEIILHQMMNPSLLIQRPSNPLYLLSAFSNNLRSISVDRYASSNVYHNSFCLESKPPQ